MYENYPPHPTQAERYRVNISNMPSAVHIRRNVVPIGDAESFIIKAFGKPVNGYVVYTDEEQQPSYSAAIIPELSNCQTKIIGHSVKWYSKRMAAISTVGLIKCVAEFVYNRTPVREGDYITKGETIQ